MFGSLDTFLKYCFFQSAEGVIVSVQPATVACKCTPLLVIVLTSAYEAHKTKDATMACQGVKLKLLLNQKKLC